MANFILTTLLGWSEGDAKREQKMLRAGSREYIMDIWRSKKLQFEGTLKRCLIDSTPQIELSWRYVM